MNLGGVIRPPHLSWLQGFLLASAALIGIVVIVSGLAVGWFFEHHVLAHEKEHAVKVVQTQAFQHLAPADFEPPRAPTVRKIFEAFIGELPGVFRIKVYDRTGRIIGSDEARLIGMTVLDDPYLAKALKGSVATVIQAPRGSEHLYEGTKGHVAEVYVPILNPGTGEVMGVIETYQDATQLMLGIRRTQRLIWGVAGGMGLFLYASLVFIVWGASVKERQATAEVRQAHERLAAILAGIADRMTIVDRQLRIVWMNAAAAKAVESGDGGLGLPCFEVLSTEPEACEGCPAVRTLLSGTVERGMRAHRLPGGGVRHLDLVTAPLRDASGRVYQVLEVARDITELVNMEERLTQSAARLEESHAALLAKTEELERTNETLRDTQAQLVEKERLAAAGQVVVGLHHSILNPLTGILGALQLLGRADIPQPERARALGDAEAEIRKIERLIRRLPMLRRAAGTPYVGDTSMLDLERSCAEEERT